MSIKWGVSLRRCQATVSRLIYIDMKWYRSHRTVRSCTYVCVCAILSLGSSISWLRSCSVPINGPKLRIRLMVLESSLISPFSYIVSIIVICIALKVVNFLALIIYIQFLLVKGSLLSVFLQNCKLLTFKKYEYFHFFRIYQLCNITCGSILVSLKVWFLCEMGFLIMPKFGNAKILHKYGNVM